MLDVLLFGGVTIRLDGQPINNFRSQTEIALLAYLAHSGQPHNREELADLLWDTESTGQSLSNLRTVLTRLRKQVGDYLIVTRKTIAVAPTIPQKTDSARFQSLLAGVGKNESAGSMNQISQGLDLYTGDFMKGFSLPNAPRFNDWLVIEQERLRQLALTGYRQLTDWQEEQGSFTAGILTAQRWLILDLWDETAQQKLMRLLAYDGRTSEALSAYEKHRDHLQEEMSISPDPDTTALYHSIQDGSLSQPVIASSLPHNLPRPLLPLFGRKEELAKLNDYLLNPEYPLVSVTGIGGIGKTSLALAAGRQLVGDLQTPFQDGIWFVTLEEIENDTEEKIKNRTATLIGQAMGLYFHGESELWTQLLGQLAAKKLLLILDNIEQFLPIASNLMMELLKAGGGVQLLATSRTAVPLGNCLAFPLAGMETPNKLSVEALQNDCVRLFTERADRTITAFHIEENLAEVVTICQFVEGMPLGIELAAASLGRLMINEIVPTLKENLHLLDTTHRDLPPRQRTFQAVFDYSWHLLTSEEQRVLAQISVFWSGFTRQAAEAVLQDSLSNLYNLLDHALLTRNELGRFRMHPLLRQLAREKLSVPSMIEMQEQTLSRHAHYFAEFMQSYEKDLQLGVSQAELEAVLPEQANLFAAWQYAVETKVWEIIASCLDGTHHFYQRKGLFSEEALLVDSAITALEKTNLLEDEQLIRLLSRLITARAWSFLHSDTFDEGIKMAERACELAQSVADPGCEGAAKLIWGRILSRRDKYPLALVKFESVVALAKSAQNQILEADGAVGFISHTNWELNPIERQVPFLKTLKLCQTLKYKRGELETLIWLGYSVGIQESLTRSLEYFEQALVLSRLLGDVTTEASVLGGTGRLLFRQGDFFGAQSYLEASLETFGKLNMLSQQGWVSLELGLTLIRLGDYATAEKRLNKVMMIAQQIGYKPYHADIKWLLGMIWNMQGRSEKAMSLFVEAYQIIEQLQYTRNRLGVLYDWGLALLNQGDWSQAEQKLQQAHAALGQGDLLAGQAILIGLAYAAYQQEKMKMAAENAEQLWQIWQDAPGWAEQADMQVHLMLGTVLEGLGDSRADDVWDKARDLLRERSEKIPDGAARKMFLEQVPAHRAILERA